MPALFTSTSTWSSRPRIRRRLRILVGAYPSAKSQAIHWMSPVLSLGNSLILEGICKGFSLVLLGIALLLSVVVLGSTAASTVSSSVSSRPSSLSTPSTSSSSSSRTGIPICCARNIALRALRNLRALRPTSTRLYPCANNKAARCFPRPDDAPVTTAYPAYLCSPFSGCIVTHWPPAEYVSTNILISDAKSAPRKRMRAFCSPRSRKSRMLAATVTCGRY
mmetsp:Transcript_5079/g.7084  ORF Transcript_5079/g.7084 Transcript_5079/m.7084 type:complete len:221 (+) Transcript_5079:1643-2305(+)